MNNLPDLDQLFDTWDKALDEASAVLRRVKAMDEPDDEAMRQTIERHFLLLGSSLATFQQILMLIGVRGSMSERLLRISMRAFERVDTETAVLSSLIDLNEMVAA